MKISLFFLLLSYAYRSRTTVQHTNYACMRFQSIVLTLINCDLFHRCYIVVVPHLIFYFALLCDERNDIQQQHYKDQIHGKSARIENECPMPAWYLAEHIFVDACDCDNGRYTPLNVQLNVDPVENGLFE